MMEILDELAGKQGRFDSKLDHVEGRLDQADKKLDNMMGRLDFVVGELQRKRTEELAVSHLIGQQGQQLIDLDTRVTKLEKAAP